MTPLIAQQRMQYSQFMLMGYRLNPAVAGTEQFVNIKAGMSYQWAGFEGAPRGFYLSAHAPEPFRVKKVQSPLPVRGRSFSSEK